MAGTAHPVIVIEENESDLKSLLPFVRYHNITNDRLVALSFKLSGSTLTRVSMSYSQRSDVPFSGRVVPALPNELATWIPVRKSVFFETAEPMTPPGVSVGFNALRDALLEFRSLDRKPAAPLNLASRFGKKHAQYLYSDRAGLIDLYTPGSAGIASVRVFEAIDRLVGIRMDAQGNATAICWMSLNQAFGDPWRVNRDTSWKNILTLPNAMVAPMFSRAFGNRAKQPEMILSIGPDLRMHFRFTTTTTTQAVNQFNLNWRVIGAPPIPTPQTCLIFQFDSGGVDIENSLVTGQGPIAANLACTIL